MLILYAAWARFEADWIDVNLSRDITERFKESERAKGNSSDREWPILLPCDDRAKQAEPF